MGNSLSRNFGKNFVKVTVLLSIINCYTFDLTKYFFGERNFFHFSHFTVWKSSTKSDHDDFFPSNHFTKIGEFWLSQMHVFIYLRGISTSNWWNISCREGFEVKFIHNEVFKPLNINMSIFLPKMGYFQKHITSSSVHLRQVFQHWKIGWTLFFQL